MKYGKKRYRQGNLAEDCIIHPVPTVMDDNDFDGSNKFADDIDKEIEEEIDEVYTRLLGLREGSDENAKTIKVLWQYMPKIDGILDCLDELQDDIEDMLKEIESSQEAHDVLDEATLELDTAQRALTDAQSLMMSTVHRLEH